MLRASNMNITTTSLVVVVLQYILLASMCIVFIVLASIFPYYTSYELVITSLLITTRLE